MGALRLCTSACMCISVPHLLLYIIPMHPDVLNELTYVKLNDLVEAHATVAKTQHEIYILSSSHSNGKRK